MSTHTASAARTPQPSQLRWTIAYRLPRANRFLRVTNWEGTWHEAVQMAGLFLEAHPEMQVYYVITKGTEELEAQRIARGEISGSGAEDHGNILVDSGRRVRMIDRGELTAAELERFAPLAAEKAHAKLIDGYFDAMRKGEEPSDAEYLAYRADLEAQKFEAEMRRESTEEEIDEGVASWRYSMICSALLDLSPHFEVHLHRVPCERMSSPLIGLTIVHTQPETSAYAILYAPEHSGAADGYGKPTWYLTIGTERGGRHPQEIPPTFDQRESEDGSWLPREASFGELAFFIGGVLEPEVLHIDPAGIFGTGGM